jgi:hypothetical protein
MESAEGKRWDQAGGVRVSRPSSLKGGQACVCT